MDKNPPESEPSHSSDYAPYLKLDQNDVAPVPIAGNSAIAMTSESNRYVTPSPVPECYVKQVSAQSIFFWLTDLIDLVS